MGGFFDRSAKAAPAFTGQDREEVVDPLIRQIQGLGPISRRRIDSAFSSPMKGQDLEKMAAGNLMDFNPNSFLQGSQGFLGSASGLGAQASGLAMSDPLGANSFFKTALKSDYTDPTKNPQMQGVLDAIINQGQRGFNIGADKIGASAQMASGGVGQSSAKTDALSRLGSDISSQVADQSANLLMNERARLSGVQQSAAQQALGQGLRQSEALSGLAGILGNLGINQGNLGLQGLMQQTEGLSNLGNRFATRDLAGAMFPLQQQMALAQLLKSGQAIQSPSMFENVLGGAGAVGNLMTAFSGGGQAPAGTGVK